MLRESCHQASTWPDDVSVAVNVSPKQFGARGIAATVLSALSASGLPPYRLELEITESIFISDVGAPVAAEAVVALLRNGAGYQRQLRA